MKTLPNILTASLRERQNVIARRETLRKTLGNKCAVCGEKENLEFDHPYGRDWGRPSDLSSHMRIAQYEKDFKAGNLRLLCGPCNRAIVPKRDEVPF